MIKLRRAYDAATRQDGLRILVERLWPRGVTKERAKIDLWLRDVAPSPALRKWFHHDPARWVEFQRRYRRELRAAGDVLKLLQLRTREGPVTFVYAASDPERNSALLLKEFLETEELQPTKITTTAIEEDVLHKSWRHPPCEDHVAHWQNRPEPAWQNFEFNQPYAKGLKRLREEVLAKTDFDPATLWQWGTMQAMAVIEVLKACERQFGGAGQKLVYEALHRVGLDVGRQILAGTRKPDDMSEAEFISFYASVINRIAYASLEEPRIDGPDTVSFDILWCPHQDHYQAFDCRVQRYFVEGMIEAMREYGREHDFDVRFDSTIPAGAPTCHFTMWRQTDPAAKTAWQEYTLSIDQKALEIAQRESSDPHQGPA